MLAQLNFIRFGWFWYSRICPLSMLSESVLNIAYWTRKLRSLSLIYKQCWGPQPWPSPSFSAVALSLARPSHDLLPALQMTQSHSSQYHSWSLGWALVSTWYSSTLAKDPVEARPISFSGPWQSSDPHPRLSGGKTHSACYQLVRLQKQKPYP